MWKTEKRPVETIADVTISTMVDVDRKTGEEHPRSGVMMDTRIGSKVYGIGTMSSVEAARKAIEAWSRHEKPGEMMLRFSSAAFAHEGSEADDGTGFNF